MNRRRVKGIWESPTICGLCIIILVFIYFPIFIIILFSFNDSVVGIFPLKGFTLKWYAEVLKDPRFVSTLKNSLYIALASTLLGSFIGISAAFAITRHRFLGKGLMQNVLILPLFIPTLFFGVSLASFFSFVDIKFSLYTVISGHTLVSIPYFFLILRSRLIGFNISIEEASRDLGASPIMTFRRITFPLIRTPILGCALIVFINSIDNFIITFFTIGSQSTLPLLIWSMMKRGVAPSINAISTILLVSMFTIVIIANRFGGGLKIEI